MNLLGQSYTDTAFQENKDLPFHRWVNWIAGFSELFVAEALERHLPYRGKQFTVLDPFSGIGTTMTTSYLRGYSSIGFEINPFPAFVTRVKYSAIHDLDLDGMKSEITHFSEFMAQSKRPHLSKPPSGFKTRMEFYSPKVLEKVLHAWDFFEMLRDRPEFYDVFRLAFGAVMVSFSNYSYEPSLGSRIASGKALINDYDVSGTIVAKLKEMYQDLIWARKVAINNSSFNLINDSFFSSDLKPESVDLLITSPPYLNNYHYIRNTRPQLFWLGFAQNSADLHYLETNNYGKYWQTVRDSNYRCTLKIKLHKLQKLLDKISAVESDRDVYGGRGWANYACEYFNDTLSFLNKTKTVLKKGSKAIIVIGNSILKGIDVPTDEVFSLIAKNLGFKEVKITKVRNTRIGSSIVGTGLRTAGRKTLYESVVEIEK
jgi:DNA modification methylase